MLLLCLIAAAFAATAEQVEARLAEIESLRAMRVEKAAPRVSSANARKAAAGVVVGGVVGSKAWSATVVNMPIGKFWAGLNDETRHPGYTSVSYSELLSGKACASGRAVLQYLPVPMVTDRWWIGKLYHNGKLAQGSGNAVRELYWRSSVDPADVTTASGKKIISKGAPIGSTRGAWFLVAIDQFSTYVEYYSNTDPGAGIPSGIANRLAGKGVKDQMTAVTKFAKQGRPVCPVY